MPLVLLSSEPIAASSEHKMLALVWAKRWHGIEGRIDESKAIPELDDALRRGRRDHLSDEGRIILGAVRAMWGWNHAAAHERTKKAFPWLRFVAIEGKPICPRAKQLNGQLLANGEHERLPLPDCEAFECSCLFIQVTEGRRRRMLDEEAR